MTGAQGHFEIEMQLPLPSGQRAGKASRLPRQVFEGRLQGLQPPREMGRILQAVRRVILWRRLATP